MFAYNSHIVSGPAPHSIKLPYETDNAVVVLFDNTSSVVMVGDDFTAADHKRINKPEHCFAAYISAADNT